MNVKIALSSELKAADVCAQEILVLMRDCNWTFKRRFGIRFHIKKIEYWRCGSSSKALKTCLARMKPMVLPGECDIVLGFIPPNLRRNDALGIANYFQGYMLLRYFQSSEAMRCLLLHELCHLFGAVDIEEPGSLMNISKHGREIDDFTSQIILLNRQRRFYLESFPLPEAQIAEVMSLFEQRARLGRREPAVHQSLAQFYFEKKNFPAALNECVYLLENYPELKEMHNIIGTIYLKQDRFEEAISAFKKALCFYPYCSEIHFNLALAYYKRGLIDAAILGYRKALDLNPNYPRAHAYLAFLYFRQRKIDEAMRECQLALNLCPEYSAALCLYAAILVHTYNSRKDKAGLSHGSDGILSKNKMIPENANDYRGNDFLENAKTLCIKALSISPESVAAHNLMGICFVYQNKFKKAESEFLKALEINPACIYAHFNLGRLYFANNCPDKAAYHLKKIIEIKPCFGFGLEAVPNLFQIQKTYYLFLER